MGSARIMGLVLPAGGSSGEQGERDVDAVADEAGGDRAAWPANAKERAAGQHDWTISTSIGPTGPGVACAGLIEQVGRPSRQWPRGALQPSALRPAAACGVR